MHNECVTMLKNICLAYNMMAYTYSTIHIIMDVKCLYRNANYIG